MPKTRRKIYLVTILLCSLFIAGCGKKELALHIDNTEPTANEQGEIEIKGDVEGKGILYVSQKKVEVQPDKKGQFSITHKLKHAGISEIMTIEYIDSKDNKNKVEEEVNIQANEEAIARKKASDAVLAERAKQEEEEKKKKEEEAKKKAAEEEATKKPIGYSFEMEGTADQEQKYSLSKEEVGIYEIECLYVPLRVPYKDTLDFGDLTVNVTIFPDNKDYDMTMDFDKALHDIFLTQKDYLPDVMAHGIDANYKTSYIRLSENNQIMVLNGKIRLSKIGQ